MIYANVFDNFFKTEIAGEVLSSVIVVLIICILAIIVGIMARRQDPLKKPKGLLLLAEIGVNYFNNMVKDLIGDGFSWLGGYIFCVSIYLFIAFIFGLTGLPSPVGNLAVPLSLGLCTFVLIHATSIRYTKWKYFKRYVEPFPVFLPVNLISMWSPLLSLSLRLFGNATAGGVLLTLIYSALSGLGNGVIEMANETLHVGAFITPIITPLLHAYFDLFSGFIQTLVFISLSIIFIGNERPSELEM